MPCVFDKRTKRCKKGNADNTNLFAGFCRMKTETKRCVFKKGMTGKKVLQKIKEQKSPLPILPPQPTPIMPPAYSPLTPVLMNPPTPQSVGPEGVILVDRANLKEKMVTPTYNELAGAGWF